MNTTKRARVTCPRCGEPMPAVGLAGVSLSRRDNRTYICDQCGSREAFEDAGVEVYDGPPYWQTKKGD